MTAPIGFSSRAKSWRVNRLSDDGDEAGRVVIVGGDTAARGDAPIGDRRIGRVHALDGRGPVLISILHLTLLADQITDLGDRGILAMDRAGVRDRERRGAAEAGANSSRRHCAGLDHDDIGAQALDLLAHRFIGALTDSHHGDQRGDADEHAEHGERGAHLVAADRLRRRGEHHEPEGQMRGGRGFAARCGVRRREWAASAAADRGRRVPTRSSEIISPSRMVTTRSA